MFDSLNAGARGVGQYSKSMRLPSGDSRLVTSDGHGLQRALRNTGVQLRALLCACMDYHFKPAAKTCAQTGKPLVPGSVCHSVLLEKNGMLTRLDYSDEGWSGLPEGHIGYWKTVVPVQNDPRDQRIDPDAALRYLEQISELPPSEMERQRYVLALLLLQQRRLKLEGARTTPDGDQLELIGLNGEGPYFVPNLKLSETETQQIQAELKVHLATEWN